MAQYNLPQFSTSPTPSYQQQPIIKLPNYGDIYARNFSIGQQTAATAFKPIREAIDKYVERKEKEEIEKKKEDERIFQAENRIADNAIAYQGIIAREITTEVAGEFEGQIEDMLYASVDGYAANEKARIIDKTISAQEYTKIKSRYIKEISDMKSASQGLINNLGWYSKNNGTMSRYNSPKLIGLLEAQKNNELNIGRNSKGGLTVYYDDLLGNKTVYTIDELKNLRAEDSVVTRLDFTNDDKNDNIGNTVFSALEDEIGTQLGVYTPNKTIISSGDSKSKIQTQTEALQFVAGKKEETIKYIANNSIYLDETMPAIAGQTWLDEMLYGDNATEQVAQARTDKFVLKYLKEEGVVNPTKAQIDEVEQIMDSYERNAPITELQTKVKNFQLKETKQFLAEKIWKERYAVQEKPIATTTLINNDVTEADSNDANKILYAKTLTNAISTASELQTFAASNDEDAYKDEIKMRGLVNSTLGLDVTNGVTTGELTENANGDFELTYDLPESVFGKNQTLVINKGTTTQDLFAFRNIAFGDWTKGTDNTKLINGVVDYLNNKDTKAAKYYEETIKGIGGALISRDAPSSESPTVDTELKAGEYPEEFTQLSNTAIIGGENIRKAFQNYGLASSSTALRTKYTNKYGKKLTEQNIAKLAFDRDIGKFSRKKYNANLKTIEEQKTKKADVVRKYQEASSTEKADEATYNIDEVKEIMRKNKLGSFPGSENFTQKDLALINYLKAGFKQEDLEPNRDYE